LGTGFIKVTASRKRRPQTENAPIQKSCIRGCRFQENIDRGPSRYIIPEFWGGEGNWWRIFWERWTFPEFEVGGGRTRAQIAYGRVEKRDSAHATRSNSGARTVEHELSIWRPIRQSYGFERHGGKPIKATVVQPPGEAAQGCVLRLDFIRSGRVKG
jgi:hypothetical protein